MEAEELKLKEKKFFASPVLSSRVYQKPKQSSAREKSQALQLIVRKKNKDFYTLKISYSLSWFSTSQMGSEEMIKRAESWS